MPICPDSRARETNITVEGDMLADWNELANRPARFPAQAHDHLVTEIVGLEEWAQSIEDDIPTKLSQLENDSGFITSTPAQVKSDWNSIEGASEILNKPQLFSGNYQDLVGQPALFSGRYEDLSGTPTLFTGAYDDLTGKPDLFDGRYASLLGKPTLFSGVYADLLGKPDLFDGDYNKLSNKPTLFDGDYNSLTNKPSIPVVNYPVTSVNSKTGNLNLTASDVGAATASHTHPINDISGLQSALNSKKNISEIKRQETYSGLTNASGTYTITFTTPYNVPPNIQVQVVNGTHNHFFRVTVTTTGFTVVVGTRAAVTVLGLEVLLAATVNASNIAVDVLVTEK